jgi:hypothetical protein
LRSFIILPSGEKVGFELGIVLAARTLWEDLGIGAAIRSCIAEGELSAPHEMALFAMAAQRLDDLGSKLDCATRWLPDIAWLPEARDLTLHQNLFVGSMNQLMRYRLQLSVEL